MVSKCVVPVLLAWAIVLSAAVGTAAPQARVYSWSSGSRDGYLGVQLQDVTKKLKEKKSLSVDKGAYVTDVVEESPAEKAGIKEGDVVVKFDGKDIQDSDDLIEAVRKTKRDTEVKIDIVSKSEKKTLSATIGRAPRSYAYSFGHVPHAAIPKLPRLPMLPHAPMHGFSFSMSVSTWNGLELQDLTRQLAEYFDVPEGRGVLVTEVGKGSVGEKAGFKAGDVITKLGGESIRDVGDISDVIHEAKKESELPCDIVRKGKPVSLKWLVSRDDDEDWEEGDDDTSFNLIVPNDCPRSPEKVQGLRRLKEDLYRLRILLQERFHEVKSLISMRISEIVHGISNG